MTVSSHAHGRGVSRIHLRATRTRQFDLVGVRGYEGNGRVAAAVQAGQVLEVVYILHGETFGLWSGRLAERWPGAEILEGMAGSGELRA